MNNKLLKVSTLIIFFLLSACGSPKPVINELSNTTSTYDETIRINNCDNKAESSQTVSRSFSTKISGTGSVHVGSENVVSGSVAAAYEQDKDTTKTQTLTAAPDTNMEFTLRWSDNVRTGNATINGESVDYTVNIPIAVEQISSKDLGCDSFSGQWEAIDAFDNSNLTMTITKDGSNRYTVLLSDDKRRNQCGTNGDEPVFAYQGEGSGEADGNVLSTNLTFWCLTNPHSQLGTHNITFTYDETTNTLSDFYVGEDVPPSIWSRAD